MTRPPHRSWRPSPRSPTPGSPPTPTSSPHARVTAPTHDDVATLVERAFAAFSSRWYESYARAIGAELAVVAGLPEAAELVAAASPYAEQNTWAAASLARTRGILYDDHDALTEAVDLWTSINARFERACTLRLLSARAQG